MIRPRQKSEASQATPDQRDRGRPASFWRAALVGSVLVAIIGWLTPTVECFNWTVDITGPPPSIAAIFFLFLVVLGNALLRRFWPRQAFVQGELALILAMVLVGSPLASTVFTQFAITNMVDPIYFASDANRWGPQFHRFLPAWIGPRDPKVIHDFFYGSPGGAVPWKAWIGPMLAWGGLTVAGGFVFFCMSVLFRKQWVEHERLMFPLLTIPLEMIRQPEPGHGFNTLFRNRLVWVGAAIPFICQLTNGLHKIYPSVPRLILLRYWLNALFPDPPWNGVGWWELSLYPFFVGIAYLLSADVSFSCWFFYLLTKLQGVAGRAMGWGGLSEGSFTDRFPYIEGQSTGACIALVFFTFWAARSHLKAVFRKALRGDPSVDDSDEPVSYRFALLGMVGGSLFLLWWAAQAGLGLMTAAFFFGIYLLLGFAGSRIRAEAGAIAAIPQSPNKLMVDAVGTEFLGTQNLTAMAAMKWNTLDTGVLTDIGEALKIPSAARVHARRMVLLVALGCLLYMGVSVWQALRLYYHYGAHHAAADQWRVQSGMWAFQELSAWLTFPRRPEPAGFVYIALGAVVLTFLAWMRLRVDWWPFHPVGYAIGNTLQYPWFSFLLGWLLKVIVIRAGGLRLYRMVLPFCFGLILGDLAGNGLWAVLALVGVRGFAFNTGTWQ